MSKAERPKSQRLRSCALVLGMHGSGTSAMARVLGNLGCQLPASAAAVTDSARAVKSSRIHDFNDELLASAGSSRDDFTPFYQEWLQSPRAPDFLDRAVALLNEEFGTADLFVLSDPSICRLLPFWMDALQQFGCTPKAVLVTRNPIAVGRSLKSRRKQNEPLSQMVWLRYMLAAEHGTRSVLRFCTSFENLMRGWEGVLNDAQDALQLVWPKPNASVEFEVAAVLDDIRDREGEGDPPPTSVLLPPWLQETNEILTRWANEGEDSGDHSALDRIKSEFDVAANAFARVIRGARERGAAALGGQATDVATMKNELQEQRRKTTLLTANLQKEVEAREALESQLIEAQAELEASQDRRKEMARVITNREEKIARLYEELAALQRHMVRSSPLWQLKAGLRRVSRAVRGPAQKANPEAQSV